MLLRLVRVSSALWRHRVSSTQTNKAVEALSSGETFISPFKPDTIKCILKQERRLKRGKGYGNGCKVNEIRYLLTSDRSHGTCRKQICFKSYAAKEILKYFSLLKDALWSVQCNYKANSATTTAPAATIDSNERRLEGGFYISRSDCPVAKQSACLTLLSTFSLQYDTT